MPAQRFGGVVANIGARTLVELAPQLTLRLDERGWLALSGISPAQVSIVTAAYPGLAHVSTRQRGEWSAVLMRRQ